MIGPASKAPSASPSATNLKTGNVPGLDEKGNYLEDDPHRAAFEDNPDRPERLTWNVILSVLFLSLAFVPSLACGFLLPTAILIQIGTRLGDTANVAWLPGSWSIASAPSPGGPIRPGDSFSFKYATAWSGGSSEPGNVVVNYSLTPDGPTQRRVVLVMG